MARYTDAACRLCRRVGDKLMLKGERCYTAKCAVERRNAPPGQHGTGSRRPKKSDRGIQLQHKQKARYTYGMLERQFRKTFAEAERLPGVTGENLLVLLERRLDNAVFRLGFGTSRAQARQLVRHGHITLNGRKTDIPSCLIAEGDVIAWREPSTKSEYYKTLALEIKNRTIPAWLSLDTEKLIGKVLRLPTAADIEAKFDEMAIVEYYSR
ncbi:MAG: 30S ribosomal protein S4 [Chloroflexi bacterium]|nr:30S ribosomal protein S4 [Chloroflexota bacterium]MBM3182709.1 30S ribosomal protein S4 [Chloroflexota bacterium]MBM4451132.1 30S ribosomal protein S4 [Chloroflexota bacterium]MBM4453036.1 30S ribosomal protein S4 [Chloroflexota bacterium]